MKLSRKQAIAALMILVLAFGLAGCSKPAPVETAPAETASQEPAVFDTSVYPNGSFLITPQELKESLKSENVLLFDCNKPDVYAKEHIPGAVGIGVKAFSDSTGKPGDPGWGTILDKPELTAALEALGIDNTKTVVFYSDVFKGPGADGRAVWQLQQAGLTNVRLLVGGLSYWKELGYEVTAEAAAATPKTGVVLKDYDLSNSASKEYVFDNLDKQVIIDVRTEGEFAGSQKVGEPRGGHIKGSVNLLWTELLNKNGTPKSPAEITDMMASLGVKPGDDFVVY